MRGTKRAFVMMIRLYRIETRVIRGIVPWNDSRSVTSSRNINKRRLDRVFCFHSSDATVPLRKVRKVHAIENKIGALIYNPTASEYFTSRALEYPLHYVFRYSTSAREEQSNVRGIIKRNPIISDDVARNRPVFYGDSPSVINLAKI